MRFILPPSAAAIAVTLAGCHHDRANADSDSGLDTTGQTSIDLTTEGSSGTSTSTTDATLNPDSSSSTTGTVNPGCEFSQCGTQCCAEGEECVLEQCLPPCASTVRCGDDLSTCCDAGDVCLQPDCVTPGADCLDNYDCPEGEFCEPTLMKCLPSQDPLECEVIPDFGMIELELEWSWEVNMTNTMPAIGDVDGDDLPDLVVTSRLDAPAPEWQAEIVILDGPTGVEKTRVGENPGAGDHGAYMRSTPALADVNGNGLADIIYSGWPQGGSPPGPPYNYSVLHAIDGLGGHLWSTHNADSSAHYIYTRNGAVLTTNLDDDDESEIVYGIVVVDDNGLVVSDDFVNEMALGGGVYGSPPGYPGGVSTAADLDGDNVLEIVSGREAFSVDWNNPPVGNPTVDVQQLWTAGGDDGYPAIADLDQNGSPEIVLVSNGVLRILESSTGLLWCGVDSTGATCSGNDSARTQPIAIADDMLGGEVGRGGPPTVADFDGDGRPEVGVAGATAYAVYDFARQGEDIVQPNGFLPPAPGDIYIRWFAVTQDSTSNATGSGVYDFQGDGAAEVLYQDECYARVYDGATGAVLVEIENPSPTVHEYPIVADVDGDGNSEFVVVAADSNVDLCMTIPNYVSRRGVFVYGDANDQWVRTRKVWTQHTYHVTNATSAALVPTLEDPNWLQPELNNFRQNDQGSGVFNAPDLSIDVAVGLQTCLDEMFEIVVTVRNEGSLGVPAGIAVNLYEGTDASVGSPGTELEFAL